MATHRRTETRLWATLYFVAHTILSSRLITANATSRIANYVALKEFICQTPVVTHKIPLLTDEVLISFRPYDIRYVDEIRQVVAIASLTTVLWRFRELEWDPDDYNGLRFVDIEQNKLWTPSILSPKSKSNPYLQMPDVLTLTPDKVTAEIPYLWEIVCDFDISNFPFDTHNCTIPMIESNLYDLTPTYYYKGDELMNLYFNANTEWTLLEYSCSITDPPDETFHYTTCWFTMKRKSVFYVSNVMIPLILMAAMTVCVFCIPAESGEKISFIVSLFVSMAVFVNFVVNNVPRSMTQIPRIIMLILTMMIKLLLCTLASSCVIRRYHAELKIQNEEPETNEERLKNRLGPKNVTSKKDGNSLGSVGNSNSGNEKIGFRNRSKSTFDVPNIFQIKSNKVGIESNLFIADPAFSQRKESTRTLHLPSIQNVKESMRHKANCCFWSKMTHSQMDKFFFWIFFISSIVVYSAIMISESI